MTAVVTNDTDNRFESHMDKCVRKRKKRRGTSRQEGLRPAIFDLTYAPDLSLFLYFQHILYYAMPQRATALESLSTNVAQVFEDAQKPNANQRKNAIAMRKIQTQICLNSPIRDDQAHDINFEKEELFINEFIRNVNKILMIRRREPHADRVTRFIATFVQYSQQQGFMDLFCACPPLLTPHTHTHDRCQRTERGRRRTRGHHFFAFC